MAMQALLHFAVFKSDCAAYNHFAKYCKDSHFIIISQNHFTKTFCLFRFIFYKIRFARTNPLFKLNRSRWFPRTIIHYPVNPLHLIYNS